MIQFNLLPDVKLAYLKARRLKRLVILGSLTIIGVVSAVVIILAVFVYGAQRTHLNNLDSDIEEKSQELRDIPDINKILTVQNQLNTLTGLHESRPQTSRIISFIQQVTPTDVTLEDLTVDFEENEMTISGEATDLSVINKYVDTLKFTIYNVETDDDSEPEDVNAFPPSRVVLTEFSRTEDGFGFKIALEFDPKIFDNTLNVSLRVPNIITTRSVTERPELLFSETSPVIEEEE